MPLLEKLRLKRPGAAGPIPKLNMMWGVTERWPNGPSGRARTLVRGFGELDRLRTNLGTSLPTDGHSMEAYASLQADIDALQTRSIGNTSDERTQRSRILKA